MGDIILFAPRRRLKGRTSRDGESAGAEIMFFTGVRYQRMADPAAAGSGDGTPQSAGGKRKRKRG